MSETNKYLVSIDLDGTLLKDDKTISEKSKAYLIDFAKKGNIVLFNSGRAPRNIVNYLHDLNLDESFIAYNGGYAKYNINGETKIIENYLEKDVLKHIYSKLKKKCIKSAMSENLDTIYIDKHNEFLLWFFNPEGMNLIQGELDKTLNKDAFVFIMEIAEPYKKNKRRIAKFFKKLDGYGVRFWWKAHYAEVYKEGVSKSDTLEKILEICRVLPEKTLVFGDSDNDYEIIKNFKNSFAMKNGAPELKEIATYITKDDNNNDGVTNSIDDFINNRLN